MKRLVRCEACGWEWQSQAARPKCGRCGSGAKEARLTTEEWGRLGTWAVGISVVLLLAVCGGIISAFKGPRDPSPLADAKPASLPADSLVGKLPKSEPVQQPPPEEETVEVEVPAYDRGDGHTVPSDRKRVPLSTAVAWSQSGMPIGNGKTVQVGAYTRRDGTRVSGHMRAAPGKGGGRTGGRR